MSYLALARKWRPKYFTEMVGQEHVLRALINALDSDRLHHAFLFTGTRGVGKTTIARILAKSINCEQGVSSQPCGECPICKEIDEGRFVDLIEVDAASRTKVEDTRELLDNVQYAPSRGRYKVYLIDEVHMLSSNSFNALLKTLEEPPPHVKFLFATTDPQKLPVTILSRCLQFNLRRLSTECIANHCQALLDKETISYEAGACKHLAIAADGSMRDGLSLLDQAIAYGGGSVNLNDVMAMLGSFDRMLVVALVEKLVQQDAAGVMQQVNIIAEQVADLDGILQAILSLMHGIALYQQVPGACEAMFEEQGLNLDTIESLSKAISAEEVQLYYQIGLTGQRDLNFAPSVRSGLEMVLLRMLAFRPATTGDAVIAGNTNQSTTVNQSEQSPRSSTPASTQASDQTVKQKPVVSNKPATANLDLQQANPSSATVPSVSAPVLEEPTSTYNSPTQDANQQVTEHSVGNAAESIVQQANSALSLQSPWHEIVAALSIGGMDKQVASQCIALQVADNTLTLALAPQSAPMLNKERQDRIQKAISELLSSSIQLVIEMQDAEGESPSARAQRIEKEKIVNAESIINQDADVQSLLDAFDGHVQPETVQPVE